MEKQHQKAEKTAKATFNDNRGAGLNLPEIKSKSLQLNKGINIYRYII